MLNPKRSTSNPGRNLRDSSVAQVAKSGAAAGDFEKLEDEDKEEKLSELEYRVYSTF
jgi:hypothetical protein